MEYDSVNEDQGFDQINNLDVMDMPEDERNKYYATLDQIEQQRVEAEEAKEPVSNTAEALNIVPDAARAITEDVMNYGKAEPDWVNIDEEAPELQTTWGKAFSDFLQMALPVIAIGASLRGGRNVLRSKGFLKNIKPGSKLDRVGMTAAEIGADVAWLDVTRQGKTDTLSGMLADLGIPMPDFLATQDSDTPEAKRVKQQLEAVGFGLFGTTIGALYRMGRGKPKNFTSTLRPKTPEAKEYVRKLEPDPWDSNPVTDNIVRDEALREASDSEMALKRFADKGGEIPDPWDTAPDNYIQSKLFDESERVPKAVPKEGLIEAVTDNYKIQQAPGNGRMQRFMSDAALDAISGGDLEKRTIIKGVEAQLNEFAKLDLDIDVGGKWKSNKEVLAATEKLMQAAMGIDNVADMKELLRYTDAPISGGQTKRIMLDPDSQGVGINLSKKLLEQFSYGRQQASALVQTSLANDITDTATAINAIGGQVPTDRAADRMLDMLEFLTYEQTLAGSYSGWLLNARKAVLGRDTLNGWERAAKEKARKVREFANELKDVRGKNPKLADALIGAYEMADGSIQDVNALTQAILDTVKLRRVGKNWGYNSPGLMLEGISGLFYAFKLSSLYTPIKAVMNNMANFMMKPIINTLGGADGKRQWVQYVSNASEYNRISAKLMSERFKAVQSLPIQELARQDYKDRILAQQEWFKIGDDYVEATGDLLFQQKLNFARQMTALGNSKWTRYSTNMMEAGDGGMNVAMILTDKKGKMYDEIMAKNGKVTGDDVKYINDWIKENGETYARGALDQDFKPLDEALKFQAGEIAMNLDGKGTTAMSSVLNKSPILKTFIMFPKTMLNSLGFLSKHTVISGDWMRVRQLDGNPEAIKGFLKGKGIDYSEDAWIAFKQQTRGRVILGSSVMGYAWSSWAAGNMTGNGSFDRATNRASREVAQRPPRSWRLYEGGPWISYDGIEPISSLLALTVDLADNFDTLGQARFEDLAGKMTYIFADNITNKTFVQGLRPLFDLMSGRTGAVESYLANLGSISILNQLGRTIDPAYREVADDFQAQLRNKWSILDAMGVDGALPYDYSPVTGEKVQPLNFIGSSLIPVRLSKSQTKAEEILSEIEYATTPALTSSLGGVELEADEISAIKKLVGERGVWAKAINKLYNSKRGQEDIKMFRDMRRRGVTSKSVDWKKSWLYDEITKVLTNEVATAKRQLRDDGLLQRENLKYNLDRATRTSDQDEIYRLLGIN